MLFLLSSVLLAACARNPTGGVNFVLMSERAEIAKGKELHEQMLKDMPIYNEPGLQAYVNQVGQRVAKTGDRPELEYHFTIIDSPDINAFALPGGYVYINRGLLAYLNSEAQLAAVLGHEIGHITARHAVRQQTASRAASVVSTTVQVASVLTTGLNPLGETSELFSGALISGYGRDMELEADSLGAEYLLNANYDPMAMVEVITILKNNEDFTKKTSTQAVNYHGLFASHPRNDTRLQEVVGKAGKLSQQQESTVDPAEFRKHMNGLPLGPSTQVATSEGRNRYYQNLLGYTMVFPDGWGREETTTTVTTRDPAGLLSLKVEAQRLQQAKEPRLFIKDDLNIPELKSTEELSQFGLRGYTGIKPGSPPERIAVIYFGPRAFVFTGNVGSDAPEDSDTVLLNTIKSFRPIARNEMVIANPVRLEYVQVKGPVTYAELARSSRLPQYPEDLLRLYNGDYPRGEPKPGEWIKVAN
ncbi:MAG: M48 family metalloprotease [Pseudomonadales bacterium]|nr:M48 family metalloprotease [Pseudomonadales bacterium]